VVFRKGFTRESLSKTTDLWKGRREVKNARVWKREGGCDSDHPLVRHLCHEHRVHFVITTGLTTFPGEPSHWTGYVEVGDFKPCDGECERVTEIVLTQKVEQAVASCLAGSWDMPSMSEIYDRCHLLLGKGDA